jgi:isopentenyl-diphosphate delta-isomerase type 1
MTLDSSIDVILVDPHDNEIGTIDKLSAHRFGMLHRAYSVMIFRVKNNHLELLLQQRSLEKYHGGGLWTNTCCSHPKPGERLIDNATARLEEEMGVKAQLKEIGSFHYFAEMDNHMIENEIDHVFVGSYDADLIHVNPSEVNDYRWMDVEALQKKMLLEPKLFTPWLPKALELSLSGLPPL